MAHISAVRNTGNNFQLLDSYCLPIETFTTEEEAWKAVRLVDEAVNVEHSSKLEIRHLKRKIKQLEFELEELKNKVTG